MVDLKKHFHIIPTECSKFFKCKPYLTIAANEIIQGSEITAVCVMIAICAVGSMLANNKTIQ